MRMMHRKIIFLTFILVICNGNYASENCSVRRTSAGLILPITKTNDRSLYPSSNILINGKNRAEVLCGDSIRLNFNFFPGRNKAEFTLCIDLNNNGIYDKEDARYGKSITFTDGDFNDSDKVSNSCYNTVITYIPGEDIPVNHILNKGIFFIIDDGIIRQIASLTIKPAGNSIFLSGYITAPRSKANIAIIVQPDIKTSSPKFMSFTDKEGYFQIGVPKHSPDGYYFITGEDRFNILENNYFQPLPAVVNSHSKNSCIALKFSPKISFLCGVISDQNNNPVNNIGVYARGADVSGNKHFFTGITDSSGFFRIGVKPGIYKIGFDAETLFPDYMYPEESDPVHISEGEIKENILFTAQKADGLLEGKVILGGDAANNVYVAAWNDKGSVWQKTNSEGEFKLKVSRELNYQVDINPEDIPSGYYVANSNFASVRPDTGKIVFSIEKASVKLEGRVTEKSSHSPLENVSVSATNGKRTVFTKTDSNGRYVILGGGGNYYLVALEENSIYNQADTSIIANSGFFNINFTLEKQKAVSGQNVKDFYNNMVVHHSNNGSAVQKTAIKYVIPELSRVILKIYDLAGKEIATLEDTKKSAGAYEIILDPSKFSNGIYMYKLQAGKFSETKKFIINKPD